MSYDEMTLEQLWEEYYKNETKIALCGYKEPYIKREEVILRWIGHRNNDPRFSVGRNTVESR